MSSPIADTAEYFAAKESQSGLRITANANNLTPQDLLSPVSPETRRPPLISTDFDPKQQWQKVLRKLHVKDDASLKSNNYSMEDLQFDDDVLPDTNEIDNQENIPVIEDNSQQDQHNFFKHPFNNDTNNNEPVNNEPTCSSSITQTEPENEATAKGRWGRTLDKVKLIKSLHTIHYQPKGVTTISTSIVPYCPPLFDPIYIALSKHKIGRSWPPVLLPFLNVDITDSEVLTQGINQWIFRIELQYGDIKWVINRTITDFVTLHYTLKIKSRISDTVSSPPNFPNQLDVWINTAKGKIQKDTEETKEEKNTMSLKRRKELSGYLRELLIKAHQNVNFDICEFLEISAISITTDMGWKGKEGYLENKMNFVVPRFCQILKPHFWKKQWVLLRDSYIAFIADIGTSVVQDVFLFDKSLQVHEEKGILKKYHHHITLENKFRRIEMKGSRREIQEWKSSIEKVMNNSLWIKNHRFGSFAPKRSNAKVKWYVDGQDHFNAVGEAIMSATSEIYIADWWLSPELYLKRPPEKNEAFRLDRLLKRKASEGVKIYIVVYKEMALALTIHSAHTKLWLQSLHPNIIVVRHPDHHKIDNSVLFWSHHEKIVVVDHRIAFIGGLDLCWGRYDTQKHRLSDYPAKGHVDEHFPGQDYSNPRVKDFMNVAQYEITLIDRERTARMPWHDMTVGMVGPIARDVARVFIQRWNFLKSSKGMHRPTVPFLMPKGEYVAARDETSFKGTCHVQLLRSSAQWSSGIEREHSIYNAYMECISKAKHFIYIENQFFISTTTEDKLLKNKIAQALVERIKKAYKKGEKFRVIVLIPLIPAFEGDLATKDATAARNVMHFQYVTISRGGTSIQEKLREAGIDPDEYISWFSLRNWEKLVPKKSKSIVSPLDDDGRECYVSELVYIHDKIMIVDDRIVLIGSANINDRSQLGNRDSEIAMLIEDTEQVTSYLNGKEYKAAKFAHSLRMRLFKEHLGLLDFNDWENLLKDKENIRKILFDNISSTRQEPSKETCPKQETIEKMEQEKPDKVLDHGKQETETNKMYDAMCLDPLTDYFYKHIWSAIAENNTLIYRRVFRCVPDDTVHTFEQHRKFLPDPNKVPHGHVANSKLHGQKVYQQLSKIQGHLVQFPTKYLKDENMLGSYLRETMTPMVIFT